MHTQTASVLADQTFAWSYWRVALPWCALLVAIVCVLVFGIRYLMHRAVVRRARMQEAVELERFLAQRRGSTRMHEAVINGEVFTPGGEFVDLTNVTVDQPTGEVPYVPKPSGPGTGTSRVAS